jgi:hypothetical protein
MELLDHLPIWLVGVLILALMTLGMELGLRLGRRWPINGEGLSRLSTPVLTVVAFVMGLSYTMAAERAVLRRAAVVAEADAIGTFWLRTRLLQEDLGAPMRETVVRYVDLHFEYRDEAPTAERRAAVVAEAGRMQEELWKLLLEEARRSPSSPVLLLVTNALNDMFDRTADVLAASENRLPGTILRFLLVLLMVGGVVLGYGLPEGARSTVLTLALAISLGGVMTLLIDLDRPHQGTLRTDVRAFVRLREQVRSVR